MILGGDSAARIMVEREQRRDRRCFPSRDPGPGRLEHDGQQEEQGEEEAQDGQDEPAEIDGNVDDGFCGGAGDFIAGDSIARHAESKSSGTSMLDKLGDGRTA